MISGCTTNYNTNTELESTIDTELEDCDIYESPTYKYLCYTQVAIANNDLSICDMIQLEGFEGKTNPVKEQCYVYIAAQRSDMSICEGLESPVYRDTCRKAVRSSENL